jgi:starch-binding outer membrane protein, SusD/RagB family
MKKNILLFIFAIVLVSCEDFLDTTDLVRKNSSNFPQTQAEVFNALAGAYAPLTSNSMQHNGAHFMSTLTSDECFGGGGDGDHAWQSMSALLRTGDNRHGGGWGQNYQGIFRCNSLLQSISTNKDIQFSSTDVRDQILGEVYALRAYYYFELARMFGHYIPLRLNPVVENLPAATADELYAQIADDLNTAITLLPNKSIQALGTSNLGHFTRWAAQSLAARVFLFYTGYYKKAELPTLSGTISKSQVINWLDDCIANSGHSLLPDYRNNYLYANALTRPDYKYSRDNNLNWAGDEGGNTEAVFSIKYSIYSSNRWVLNFGIRQLDRKEGFPFRNGWGGGPVNPLFFQQWLVDEPDDIRRNGSILDLSDPNEGMNYTWGGDQGEETGYVIKKLQNVNAYDVTGKILNHSLIKWGTNDGQATCNADQIMIRFSDVLLMHSELKEDATGLNLVRERVGLPPVAYSPEAIQKERRYELAFEGYRYYDLLRWYGAAEGNNAGTILEANQNGATYYRIGNAKTMSYNLTKRIYETGGFFEIPKTEIDLSEDVLKQNPGWVGSGILFVPQ